MSQITFALSVDGLVATIVFGWLYSLVLGNRASRARLLTIWSQPNLTGYRTALGGGLRVLDRFFGPRLLGARAFRRCLAIALVYPSALALIAWLIRGDAQAGPTALLPGGWPGWLRVTYAGAWVLAGVLTCVALAGLGRGRRRATRALLGRLGLDRSPTSRLAPAGRGSGHPIAAARRWARRAGVAVSFGIGVLSSLTVCALALSFGYMLGLRIESGWPAGNEPRFAGSVMLLAYAIGMLAWMVVRRRVRLAESIGLLSFVAAIAVIGAGSANDLTLYGDTSAPLAVFALLPIVNATFDWASWAVSRGLLRRLASSAATLRVGLAHAALDLALAVALLASLAFTLGAGAEAYARAFQLQYFGWRDYVVAGVADPFGAGLMLSLMLASTLVPTIAHAALAMLIVVARVLSPAHRWTIAQLEAHAADEPPDHVIRPLLCVVITLEFFVALAGAMLLLAVVVSPLLVAARLAPWIPETFESIGGVLQWLAFEGGDLISSMLGDAAASDQSLGY